MIEKNRLILCDNSDKKYIELGQLTVKSISRSALLNSWRPLSQPAFGVSGPAHYLQWEPQLHWANNEGIFFCRNLLLGYESNGKTNGSLIPPGNQFHNVRGKSDIVEEVEYAVVEPLRILEGVGLRESAGGGQCKSDLKGVFSMVIQTH